MPNVRVRVWLLAAAVFALATALYAHTWNFGLTFLDDNEIILTRAQMLAKSSSFIASFTHRYFLSEVNTYYRPLVNLSFVVDAHLGGSNPWVYHATGGLLHAVACLLLFVLMLRLRIHQASAFVATLLFAVHPMHVASVAWIPGRNDLLLGCFTLGALGLLSSHGKPWASFGHSLCFAGALLCKETAIALPVVFVLCIWAREGWSTLVRARALWLAWLLPLAGYYWLRTRCLSLPPGYTASHFRSALQHPGMLVSDIGKVVFPVHLQVIASARDIAVPLGVVALAALSFTIIGLRRKLRAPVVVQACALLLLPLAMALLASDFIALESRLYLPVAGMCLLTGECLQALRAFSRRAGLAALVIAVGVGIVFATVAVRYSEQFSNRFRFAEAAIKASPRSYLAIWLNAQSSIRPSNGPRRPTKP